MLTPAARLNPPHVNSRRVSITPHPPCDLALRSLAVAVFRLRPSRDARWTGDPPVRAQGPRGLLRPPPLPCLLQLPPPCRERVGRGARPYLCRQPLDTLVLP